MRMIRIRARRAKDATTIVSREHTAVNNYIRYYVNLDTLAGARVSELARRVKRFLA